MNENELKSREIAGTDADGNTIYVGNTVEFIEHPFVKPEGVGVQVEVLARVSVKELNPMLALEIAGQGLDPDNTIRVHYEPDGGPVLTPAGITRVVSPEERKGV